MQASGPNQLEGVIVGEAVGINEVMAIAANPPVRFDEGRERTDLHQGALAYFAK